MANDDVVSALGGLRPVCQPYGSIKRSYYKLTTSATAKVYIGQPMDLDGDGFCTAAAAGTAGAGVALVGAVVGFAGGASLSDRSKCGLPTNMSLITQGGFLPANTDAWVCIADDPNQEFVIQEASTGTALGSANIGNSTGFIYTGSRSTVDTGSGNALTGSSYAELSVYEVSATTSGSLRIVSLADNMNSDGSFNNLGAYAKWRVRIVHHRLLNPQMTGIQ